MHSRKALLLICSLAFFLSFVKAQTPVDSLPDTAGTVDSLLVLADSLPEAPSLDSAEEEEVAAIPDARDLEIEGELNNERVVHLNLSSPYHTVLSHLYFLQEDSYHPDSAAYTLYVKDPKDESAQELAIQLKQYMDGAGYFIDLDLVPSETDFTDSVSGQQLYRVIPEVPEVFVYKKGNRWVYSYATVKAIPGLHSELFPFGTLDWLPKWSRGHFLGLHIWQWMGIILYLVLAVLLHKLLTMLVSTLLERFLKRFIQSDYTHEFFEKVARPISFVVLFYTVFAFTSALQLPIELNQWVVLAFRIMIPVFWMFIGIQAVNLVMAVFQKRAEATETTLDDQLVPLLRRLGHFIVAIVFLIVILNVLRVNINALLGGLAFGSLALALAAQDTVKNLFGSILIFVDRPFQIGDWIIVGDHEGVVEEVSVRSTRIRTFANSLIYIPNGNLADSAINNMGVRTYRRFTTRVGVTYDTPPDLLEIFVEGIRDLIKYHPTTRKDYFEVHFNEMGDSSLQILIYAFFEVPTWTDELAGKQRLLLGIMRLAEDLGISFAFPTQTLHIETFPEKKGLTPPHDDSHENYKAKMKSFIDKWKDNHRQRDLGKRQDGSAG